MPSFPRLSSDDWSDENARDSLRAKVEAEQAYFRDLMGREPAGFLALLPILMDDDPKALLVTLDPEVSRLIFQLAAMACAGIVAEAEEGR